MSSDAPTPATLARHARAQLAAASPWRAPRRAGRYFKPWERVYTWGVSTPRWRRPRLAARLERWTRSRTVWLRRAAAVALVPLARRGERLDAAYRVATALGGDHEDLIHKATGWLLREAGKTDRRRLESYLRRHGSRLPRTTLRYAIERFPALERREILLRTRRRP